MLPPCLVLCYQVVKQQNFDKNSTQGPSACVMKQEPVPMFALAFRDGRIQS